MPQYKLFHWKISIENYLQYGALDGCCFCHQHPFSLFWLRLEETIFLPYQQCVLCEAGNIPAPGVAHMTGKIVSGQIGKMAEAKMISTNPINPY